MIFYLLPFLVENIIDYYLQKVFKISLRFSIDFLKKYAILKVILRNCG